MACKLLCRYNLKVSCWAQSQNLPDHLSFIFQECFLRIMYISCYSSILMNAIGPIVDAGNLSDWMIIEVNFYHIV